MRLFEIFPDCLDFLSEDSDVAAIAADNMMATAKRQKKQAEIGKLSDKIADKRKEITSIKSISPVPAQ